MALGGARHPRLAAALLAVAVLVLCSPGGADARKVPGSAARQRPLADSPAGSSPSSGGARSPSGQPLLSAQPAAEAEEERRPPGPEPDPLVGNGLGSPSCRSSIGGELAASSRRHCETSGFIAAAAPTDNYGLDVHIDTGLLPLSGGGLMSTVQSLLVTPEWLGLVWLVHALVVMLEWCFSLDVIQTGAASGLTAGLGDAESSFTTPLLALALALAAILTAYRGLVRREVAQTLGEAAMTVAMIGGGLWLMLDPSGTVGALSRWSDQAGLGTLAVAAQGSPAAPGHALGAGLSGVFAATIEEPWCYLEFGDVGWCRQARELDPALRAAGLKIAASELAQAGCGGTDSACKQGSAGASLLNSARLLREAPTNGALFLALAPNGPDRNSINKAGSLLRVLCGTSDATACAGPAAAQAEFRTNAGTWPRVTGLMLIVVGMLGMLLLFGYVALRLLTAAVLTLFFLLLVPGVVLTPALGERGRAVFRLWAGRLFGAIVSKLVFAFLLGVLLAVTSVVEALNGIGWWAQWLLLSAFWWGAFLRRHQLLALPQTAIQGSRRDVPRGRLRVVRETLDTTRHAVEWRERRRERQQAAASADAERLARHSERGDHSSARPSRGRGSPGGEPPLDTQAIRTLEVEASARRRAAGAAAVALARRAPRLARIEREQRRAGATGDRRREALLDVRRERLTQLLAADEATVGAEQAERDPVLRRRQIEDRTRFLDRQAELPGAAQAGRTADGRDYAALAGLAHRSRAEYEQLPAAAQRAARLEIDRELALRRARSASSGAPAGHDARTALDQRGGDPAARPRGAEQSIARRRSRPPVPANRSSRSTPGRALEQDNESPVMRDARAVAEGRKRQLGIGRP